MRLPASQRTLPVSRPSRPESTGTSWAERWFGGILAFITVFKPAISPFTTPIYAAAEGVFLGGLSAVFEYTYPGIVPEAVALTFGTLAALLTAYATRIIRPSENFKLGIVAATGGIALFYLVSMVLSLFHVNIPMVHDAGPVGIGFSVLW